MRRSLFPVLLLLVPLLFSACGKDEAPPPAQPRPVVTYTAPDFMQSREWSTSGTTKDSLETILSFRVKGAIVERPVKVGQKVEQGELIAGLDPTDYELEVKRARAALEDAKALLRQTSADHRRMKQLLAQQVVAASEYDKARAAYESAAAQVDSASKQLEIAEQNLAYTRLTAPAAGHIVSLPVEVHENVAAGQNVATLSAGGRMEVQVGAPDQVISYLEVGRPASVRFEFIKDEVFPAVVTEVGVKSGEVATYPVTVTLAGLDPRLRSGMVAEVTFPFPEFAGLRAIRVPATAVFAEPGGGSFVWIVERDDSEGGARVAKRGVKVGLPVGDSIIVREGLAPGDTVVIRGVHSLVEGQEVRVEAAPNASPATQ